MSTRTPSENDRQLADERNVRLFLERAAPIILESQVLDSPRFESVCELADRLGLSRDQLACELRLLQQRGVITSAPWDQLEEHAQQTTTPVVDSANRPPCMPPPPAPLDVSTTVQAVQALQERAAKILQSRGTITPRTRRKLEQAGKQAGLSKSQIAAVLDALPQPGQKTAAIEPPLPGAVELPQQAPQTTTPPQTAAPQPQQPQHQTNRGTTNRVTTNRGTANRGTAERGTALRRSFGRATTAPGAPTPSELFRRWVDQKLSDFAASILAVDDEHGLVGVGVHRYHLAQVLASHIVRDVATERKVRLERDLDAASCNSTVGTAREQSADDDRLREFFEQVAPILTQHRGINAKSRVMMNAVAERLGLTEQELERALATLQRHTRDPDEEDPRQLERRESFRAYLRRAMAQLPNGIVTFKTHWRLCQAGEHFHGVSPKWIESTIKEVASEIGARFISKEQAIEHVTQLVEDQLAGRPIIDNATRARIYTEGTRWGLDPMDVDAIIRERTEALRHHLAVERRRTRRVLNFVIGGLATAGMILVGLFLLRPPVSSSSTSQPVTPPASETDLTPAPLRGLTWWDDQLRIAQARLRITRPDLRPVLDQVADEQSSARGEAYEQLVQQYSQQLPSRSRRGDCEKMLVGCYALDTSDMAANSLATSLIGPLQELGDHLPADPESLDNLGWICQVAAQMLKDPDTPILRRNRLANQLDDATGTKTDPLLDEEALAHSFQGAVARRLYQLLTRGAADDTDRTSTYYDRVAALAAGNLTQPELEMLDSDLLAVVLPAVGDRWDRYADALARLGKSTDPNTVLKLLGMFRHSTDDRLRNYLAGLFFDRLGAEPGTLTENEMIQQLRESLGVASQQRLLRRWKHVDRLVADLLGRRRVDNTNPDVLIQETLELVYAATLACALTRGESAGPTFDELQSKGPTRLALSGGPWSAVETGEYRSPYPVSKTAVLQSNITKLASSKDVTQRLALLNLIVNQADEVPDIDPASGQLLADYLVQFKADGTEHERILPHVKRLAQWNSVRLGLADQILDITGRDGQFQEVLGQLFDAEVSLATQEARDQVRQRLLVGVLSSLSEVPFTEDPKYSVFDEGSQAIRELYAQQAKLLDVPRENYQAATRGSDVVVALVNHLAAQLNSAKLDAADKALLAELSYQSKALDFVTDTDLQYTAAVQRLWLRVLALYIIAQRPESATAVRQILTESTAAQSTQPRVFEQLRDVQTSLLQLWMQLRPSFEGSELEGFDSLEEMDA